MKFFCLFKLVFIHLIFNAFSLFWTCFVSSKRKEKYKEFMDFTDTELSKILKHSSTTWLSLEKRVNRLLEHWPALLFFSTPMMMLKSLGE